MSSTKISNEQWDFVDAEGSETRLPAAEATGPSVDFPTRWRVFGPLKSKVGIVAPQTVTDIGASALIEGLTCLPDKLKIEGESYVGQDVNSAGDTLDLNALCEAFSTVYFDARRIRSMKLSGSSHLLLNSTTVFSGSRILKT